jgi:hypothetical protein
MEYTSPVPVMVALIVAIMGSIVLYKAPTERSFASP